MRIWLTKSAARSLLDLRTTSDLSCYSKKMANAALSSVAAPTQTTSPPLGMPGPSQEDFVYSPTQAKATIAFGAIVTTLTVVSVAARLYTHKFIIRRVRIDDVWAVIAMVCHLGCARVGLALLTRLFRRPYLRSTSCKVSLCRSTSLA